MVARYGDRTRVTSQVSTWGKKIVTLPDGTQVFEETFLAPGTWTWPGEVTCVEAFVVGGGGGGGTAANGPSEFRGNGAGGGGGGAAIYHYVPVSGPVPVVVGAGGIGAVYPGTTPFPVNATAATSGGVSYFGSFSAGGGGAGGNANGTSPAFVINVTAGTDGTADPTQTIYRGGGGGGAYVHSPGVSLPSRTSNAGDGGSFTTPGLTTFTPNSPVGGGGGGGAGHILPSRQSADGSIGVNGFGEGGGGGMGDQVPVVNLRMRSSGGVHGGKGGFFLEITPTTLANGSRPYYNGTPAVNGFGGGGGGAHAGTAQTPVSTQNGRGNGGDGGSGVVIVRWLA